MQPHLHPCRVTHQFRETAQLRGELFTGFEAAIHVEQLEQIDNGGPPVEFVWDLTPLAAPIVKQRRLSLSQIRHSSR